MTKAEQIEWLRAKLADAELALKACREGSAESWKDPLRPFSQTERLEIALRQNQIAIKLAKDVATIKAIIELIKANNDLLLELRSEQDRAAHLAEKLDAVDPFECDHAVGSDLDGQSKGKALLLKHYIEGNKDPQTTLAL